MRRIHDLLIDAISIIKYKAPTVWLEPTTTGLKVWPTALKSKSNMTTEWSKALAAGANPQGRGFEPYNCHF